MHIKNAASERETVPRSIVSNHFELENAKSRRQACSQEFYMGNKAWA